MVQRQRGKLLHFDLPSSQKIFFLQRYKVDMDLVSSPYSTISFQPPFSQQFAHFFCTIMHSPSLSPDAISVAQHLATTPSPISATSYSSSVSTPPSTAADPTPAEMRFLHNVQNNMVGLTSYDSLSRSVIQVP